MRLFESVWAAGFLLAAAAAVILVAGPRMVRVADRLADVTGLGEAIVGAVFVGAATRSGACSGRPRSWPWPT